MTSPKTPSQKQESKLAQKIATSARKQHIIYERTRHTWMQYGAVHQGVWSEIDDNAIAERVLKALQKACPEGFSARCMDGVTKLLRVMLGRTLPPLSREYLPFRNGLLHLPTRTWEDHTPERGVTWVLPYDYDPQASCRLVLDWLKETTAGDGDTINLLRAYLRAIVVGAVDQQKFLEIVGPGGSGKGTFCRLACALVGYENTVATKLSLLEKNRFETAALVGKRLVLISEADRYTSSVETLKALTGGDMIRAEQKFGETFQLDCQAMVIVTSNEAIQSPEYTSGLARRRLTVEFRHQPDTPRDLLDYMQGQPVGEFVPELPGMLNWVLTMPEAEMDSTLRDRATATQTIVKARTLIATNPLAAWANECLALDPSPGARAQVGVARRAPGGIGYDREDEWLYANYRAYADAANFQAVSVTRFSDLLVDLCQHQLRLPDVHKSRDRDGVHVTGLRLRTGTEDREHGFIDHALSTTTRATTECDDSVMTSTPASVDCVDSVDSCILRGKVGDREPIERGGVTDENPSKSSHSTPPRAEGITEPRKSVTVGVHVPRPPSGPRRAEERWLFGRRRE